MSRGISRNELIDEHEKVVAALKAENASLREALKWYAKPINIGSTFLAFRAMKAIRFLRTRK